MTIEGGGDSCLDHDALDHDELKIPRGIAPGYDTREERLAVSLAGRENTASRTSLAMEYTEDVRPTPEGTGPGSDLDEVRSGLSKFAGSAASFACPAAVESRHHGSTS